MSPANKSLLFIPSVALGILTITAGIVFYAQGYRVNFNKKPDENLIKTTGIIAATSNPKNAAIYLNDKLNSTTESTLNLDPGSYTIKILKDGYLPWQKQYQVKAEVVFTTNANLFKSVPDLEPLTLSGAKNPSKSPDGQYIIYAVSEASSEKNNGLFLYQTSSPLNPIASNPTQLSTNLPNLNWSNANFEISPDNRELIAYFGTNTYLLPLTEKISTKNIKDISQSQELQKTKDSWQNLDTQILKNQLTKLPKDLLAHVATDSSASLSFNSQNTKVIYKSNKDTVLTDFITPPVPAKSTQPQTRQIQKDSFYVYDLLDDTNYQLPANTFSYSWIPGSDSIIFQKDGSIFVMDHDTQNLQKLYAGLFDPSFITTSKDGSKLILLTSPYPGAQLNLYGITIR